MSLKPVHYEATRVWVHPTEFECTLSTLRSFATFETTLQKRICRSILLQRQIELSNNRGVQFTLPNDYTRGTDKFLGGLCTVLGQADEVLADTVI